MQIGDDTEVSFFCAERRDPAKSTEAEKKSNKNKCETNISILHRHIFPNSQGPVKKYFKAYLRKMPKKSFILVASALLGLVASLWYTDFLVLKLIIGQYTTSTTTVTDNNAFLADNYLLSTQQQLQHIGITPLLLPDESDPWIQTLYDRLDRIRLKCGGLCSINDVSTLQQLLNASNGFSIEVPDINCHAILSMEEIDAGDLTFPSYPPDELIPFYSLNNAIPITKRTVWKQGYLGGEARQNIWTKEKINEQVQQAIQGNLTGTYGIELASYVREGLKPMQHKISNGSILVIGSEQPWVESIVLSLGASNVTTLEYGAILSQHEQITTETPASIREKYLDGSLLTLFDGVVSYSSIEHSGLGRYGDALNPWGDILAVARGWCLTKNDGFLYLGLPTHNGVDSVLWNAHRVYGKLRWPLVTANWKSIGENPPWTGDRQSGIGNLFVKVMPP